MKYCLAIDGSYGSFLDCPGVSFSSSSCTIEAWIRTAASDQQTIFVSPAGAGAVPRLALGDDRLQVYWDSSGRGPGVWSGDTTPVSDGTWHHVAVSMGGGSVSFFKDGVLKDSMPVAEGLASGSDAQLGPAYGSAGTWDGQLADVRIWGVARDAADIESTMYESLGSPYPDLLANWAFTGGTCANVATGDECSLVQAATVVPIRSRPSYWFGGWIVKPVSTYDPHLNFATLNGALGCEADGTVLRNVSSGTIATVRAGLPEGAEIYAGISDVSGALSSESARTTFATGVANFCADNDVDGIDLDFEDPQSGHSTPPEMRTFSLLCEQLGNTLMPNGEPLSIALTLYYWAGTLQLYEWEGVVPYVDRYEIMGYDMVDPPGQTGCDCDLTALRGTVAYLEGVNVPSDRMTIGVPLYVRAWKNVEVGGNPATPGLHQNGDTDDGEGGLDQDGWLDIYDLLQSPDGAEYEVYDVDDDSYVYSATYKKFINWQDETALQKRGDFARSIGGAWTWYLGLDGSPPIAMAQIAASLFPPDPETQIAGNTSIT